MGDSNHRKKDYNSQGQNESEIHRAEGIRLKIHKGHLKESHKVEVSEIGSSENESEKNQFQRELIFLSSLRVRKRSNSYQVNPI